MKQHRPRLTSQEIYELSGALTERWDKYIELVKKSQSHTDMVYYVARVREIGDLYAKIRASIMAPEYHRMLVQDLDNSLKLAIEYNQAFRH